MKRILLLSAILVLAMLAVNCEKEDVYVDQEEEEPIALIDTLVTANGVAFVRTPEANFANLPDWPYPYQYVEIDGLRQAYAEAGPVDGPVVLLLHGQPSWSYLYRKMIPVLADAGYRVIAMDHLGMGRSDKPVDINSYSYLGHNERLEQFIRSLGLQDINLFVQDWGSLIGLRVAGLNSDWFATIAVGNGALPVVPAGVQPYPPVENPDEILELRSPYADFPPQQMPFYNGCELIFEEEGDFGNWMEYAMKGASFSASEVLEALTWYDIPADEEVAYDAPYPSREYMAGIRVFPSLINDLPGLNDAAWAGLTAFEKPFLTIWAANDAGNLGTCEAQQNFIINVSGAEGQAHDRLPEASHFLQDDQGAEIARRLVEFYEANENTMPQVGFEILQVVSPNEIITWLNAEMTEEEFNAIELPQGWFKNQPREGDPDKGEFARSPAASEDGEFVDQEHFGHMWRHVATITEADIALDEEGLLSGNRIAKYHTLSFNAWKNLKIIVSPTGERYVRMSRDLNRSTDQPNLPGSWQELDFVTTEELIIELPNPTLNIRTDNEDSYQGPIEF